MSAALYRRTSFWRKTLWRPAGTCAVLRAPPPLPPAAAGACACACSCASSAAAWYLVN